MSDEHTGLSARGAARKDAIFGLLVAAQRARRSRLALARGAAGGALLIAIVAGGALRGGAGRGTPQPRAADGSGRGGPAGAAPEALGGGSAATVVIVKNDPSVLARFSDSGDASRASVIDDAELADWLARAGRPVGRIRTPGRFLLASDVARPVAPGGGSG